MIEEFKIQSTPRVCIIIGPHGSGKSTVVSVCSQQLGLKPQTWSPKDLRESVFAEFAKSELDQLMESLKGNKRVFVPGLSAPPSRSVMIVDYLPLNTAESKAKFKEFMKEFVQMNKMLVFFLLSEYSKAQVQKTFGDAFRSCSLVEFNPISKTKILAVLRNISSSVGIESNNTVLAEIEAASFGNLRRAINQLHSIVQEKDENHFIGLFHALGKFLYNKRLDLKGKVRTMTPSELSNKSTRPALYFHPETIIKNADVDTPLFWQFLHENYLDFFNDVGDCSDLLEYFSFADILSSFKYVSNDEKVIDLPSFICGRAVLDSNTHPQPNKFTALAKPRVLAIQKEIENRVNLLRHEEFIDNRLHTHVIDVAPFNINRYSGDDWLSQAADLMNLD